MAQKDGGGHDDDRMQGQKRYALRTVLCCQRSPPVELTAYSTLRLADTAACDKGTMQWLVGLIGATLLVFSTAVPFRGKLLREIDWIAPKTGLQKRVKVRVRISFTFVSYAN